MISSSADGYRVSVLTDREWLELYPKETSLMLRDKLAELEPAAAKLQKEIVSNFKRASENPNNIDIWLVYDFVTEISLIPQLVELKRQIKRFKWLLTPQQSKKSGITDTDIDQARQVPLETIIGVELRSAGGGKQKGLCPFHNERTPSFIVFPDNHYHCFSCGEHGNPIDFLMKKEQLTFQEAVARLRNY